MQTLHLMNADKRNASVAMKSVCYKTDIRLGLPGRQLAFIKYFQASDEGMHESLVRSLGQDYGQALIDGDPEVNMELVGRGVGPTNTVFLTSTGEVMHAAPSVVDVVYAPDGSEKERKVAEDIPSNVRDEIPVRWTGKKFPKAEAVRRFAFRRTIQLQHTDGLTFDFLFAMAKELHDEKAVVLMAGGESGKEPLILQANGVPYRGFLEGRIDGNRYQLLLHLSNMELKAPGNPNATAS
jgi:hypothetical protein